MRVIVAYDVCTETKEGRKRLRKVAQICKDYGQRVQKSVFECSISLAQYEEIRKRLVGVTDDEEDSLRLYRLTEAEYKQVEHFGKGVPVDFEGPLIV